MQRRLFLCGSAASCVVLLTGCAGISTLTLDKLGSEVVHADVNFNDIYTYAERSNTAYRDKRAIKSKYPLTIRINSPMGPRRDISSNATTKLIHNLLRCAARTATRT